MVDNLRDPFSFADALTGGTPSLRAPLTFSGAVTGGEPKLRADYLFTEPLTGGNPNIRVSLMWVEALIPVPEELPVATLVFPTLQGKTWQCKKNPKFNTGRRANTSGKRVKNAFQTYPTWQFEWVYEFLRDDNVANGYLYSDLRVLQGFFMRLAGGYGNFLFHDKDDYHVLGGTIATADGVTLQFPFVRDFGGFSEPVGQIDLSALASFASTAVNTTTDAVNVAAHGLTTGQGPVWVSNAGGALPTALAAATAYWVIVVDVDHFKLASSLANAMAGTAINITAQGSGTDTLTKGIAVYDNGALQGPAAWSLTLPNQLVFASAPLAGHLITADFDFYFVCDFSDDTMDADQFASKLWELQKLDFESLIQ
jgi:hypothetical protein